MKEAANTFQKSEQLNPKDIVRFKQQFVDNLLGDYKNGVFTERILNYKAKPLSTIKTFYTNYKNMLNDKSHINSDKFYHAKANCEAGQFYDPANALILDFAKELNDLIQKNIFKRNGLTFKQNMQDSANDLQADYYGLTRGLLNPFLNCGKELDRSFLNGLNKID